MTGNYRFGMLSQHPEIIEQTNTRLGRKKVNKKNRTRDETFHDCLKVLADSPLRTNTLYVIRKKIQFTQMVKKHLSLLIAHDLVRKPTKEEAERFARYMLEFSTQDYHVPHRLKGRGYTRVKAYASKIAGSLFVITEKGLKLLKILEKMQELVVSSF